MNTFCKTSFLWKSYRRISSHLVGFFHSILLILLIRREIWASFSFIVFVRAPICLTIWAICPFSWTEFVITTGIMVLEKVAWSAIISCITFEVSHGDASVDPLLDSLSFLAEEDFRVPLQTWLGVIPLIQWCCFSLPLGVLRRFLDVWENLLQKPWLSKEMKVFSTLCHETKACINSYDFT